MPEFIEIPSIGVKASVVPVGLLPYGQMEVPRNTDAVGWYSPGAAPGQGGNAVMVGHVDSKTGPAVFFNLNKLKPGDPIIVRSDNSATFTYSVEKVIAYHRSSAPMEQIFGPTGEMNLNLITCTGKFDTTTGTHEERLVVYAGLIDEKNRVPPS